MHPAIECLHQSFEAQASMRPNAKAVVCGSEVSTYAGLERRANRLARTLLARGVRRGSTVAVLLGRSVDAHAAMLGVMKAGAAWVPLDPEAPVAQVNAILADTDADVLVTTAALGRRHDGYRGAVVRIDSAGAAIAAESPERLPPYRVGVRPHDLCCIIYRSGTHGQPQGVMVEHRNAIGLVQAEAEVFAVRPEDRVTHSGRSVLDHWLAFGAGATLVVPPSGAGNSNFELAALLVRNRVTVLSCMPALLAGLPVDIPSLRLVILGGVCPPSIVERWSRVGRRLVQTYGPTEATGIATCADLDPKQSSTAGRTVPGCSVHVLDARLRSRPPGEPGEIWIGGNGVARGYVGRVAETAARFVATPVDLAARAGDRLYRTGDFGCMDPDGNIEFLGRADSVRRTRLASNSRDSYATRKFAELAAVVDAKALRSLSSPAGVPRDAEKEPSRRTFKGIQGILPYLAFFFLVSDGATSKVHIPVLALETQASARAFTAGSIDDVQPREVVFPGRTGPHAHSV